MDQEQTMSVELAVHPRPTEARPHRILLLKAYQPVRDQADSPPLGLLYLVTALRGRFGEAVDLRMIDLKLD